MGKEFKQIGRDNNLSLVLSIIRNNGVVTKGVVFKKKEYDFFVKIDVINPKRLKITKVELFYLDKSNQYVPLKGALGVQNMRLSTKQLDANILFLKARIEYKVGFSERKQLTVTCRGTL